MSDPPVVLLHGAATTSRIWRRFLPALDEAWETSGGPAAPSPCVVAPDRPQTGSLERELEALRPLCAGAFLVGVSGGATLAWALLAEAVAAGVRPFGGVLHEPAAGSLAPGLLSHVADALADAGLSGFGTALYGTSWSPTETDVGENVVRSEFAMFGAFEPSPLDPAVRDHVTLTVGEDSPSIRHRSVAALSTRFGVTAEVVPGRHAVHLDHPGTFATCIATRYLAAVT